MTFVINNASNWLPRPEDKPPYKGAVWDAEVKNWVIEISTLEEMMALSAEFSPACGFPRGIILFTPPGEIPEIQIYDNYIET